jgi:hypothetical protein
VWQNVVAALCASEQQRGFATGGAVVDQQADVLGRVTGGVEDLEADIAQVDDFAVGDGLVRVV